MLTFVIGFGFIINTYSDNQREEVALGKIVITPYLESKVSSIQNLSSCVRVITKEDIKNSTATTVIDVLRKTSLLDIKDWYGTGIKVSVDLMGFGDAASSNTLILLDGIPLNSIDLSGVDWSIIPLESVERIEIIKGEGAVLYGDNAIGGIVNIITKKAKENKLILKAEKGSYDLHRENIVFQGIYGNLSLTVDSEHFSTDGYRINSQYRSRKVFAKITHSNKKTKIKTEAIHHRYNYGLPGDLLETEINNPYSRKDSKDPLDNTEGEENFLRFSLTKNFIDETSDLNLQISYRNKNMYSNYISSNYYSKENIHYLTIKPFIYLEKNILFPKDIFIVGGEFNFVDYSSDSFDNTSLTSASDVNRKGLAVFSNLHHYLTDNLILNYGFRHQREKFNFDYEDYKWGYAPLDEDKILNEQAYEVGINYKTKKAKYFFRYSKAFRIPKTDEFVVWDWSVPKISLNSSLDLQKSHTFICGFNHQFLWFSLDFDVFYTELKNEIYYDNNLFKNTNYPHSKRTGIDLKIKKEFKKTSFNLDYSLVKAKFEKGIYQGSYIPGVPKNKVNFSFYYHPYDFLDLFCNLHYIDKQYFINDLNNDYGKLDNYVVVNIGLKFHYKNFILSLGINNLFDKEYSEYGALDSTKRRGVYPLPERNYIFKVEYRF